MFLGIVLLIRFMRRSDPIYTNCIEADEISAE